MRGIANELKKRRVQTPQECGAARKILRLARFEISKFGPRKDDPPDCEGFVNGKWSAVE
jgi:hypothetical protein